MRKVIPSLVIAIFCVAASTAFAQVGAVKGGVKKAGDATADATKKGAKATEKGQRRRPRKRRTPFNGPLPALTARPIRPRSRRTRARNMAA